MNTFVGARREEAYRATGELAEELALEVEEKEMSLKRTMHDYEVAKLNPGVYTVTCVDVKPDTLENPQFGNGDVIRFVLQFDDVSDPDGEPTTREKMCNDNLSPMSNLTRYMMAFGVSAQIGEDIDLEAAIGKQAQAKVIEHKRDDRVFDRIDDLFPLPVAKETADDSLDAFWRDCRKEGFTAKAVRQTAMDIYGKEPRDMTPEERKELLEQL